MAEAALLIPEVLESVLPEIEAAEGAATAAASSANEGATAAAAAPDAILPASDGHSVSSLGGASSDDGMDNWDLDSITSEFPTIPDSTYKTVPPPKPAYGSFVTDGVDYKSKPFNLSNVRSVRDRRGLGYNYTEAPNFPTSLSSPEASKPIKPLKAPSESKQPSSLQSSQVSTGTTMPTPLDGKTKETPKLGSSPSLAAGIGLGVANALTGGIFGLINSAVTASQQRKTEQARLDRTLAAADSAGVPRANLIDPGGGPARQHVIGKGTSIYSSPNFLGGSGKNSSGTYLGFN